MASPDRAAWLNAMEEEFEAFKRHSVGTLVDAPPGANVIGGMWVFTRKRDEFNRICRFKARWVVFGNHQIKGLDYNDTHASVGMTDSLRILLAIASSLGMKVCQFNIVTAFLNGEMGDVVYSRQVTGFEHPTHPHRVWLLNKSLYRTRQAAKRWQQHFNKTAAKFKLVPSPSTRTEWRCHVDVIKPFHFFYDSNSFCSRSESFPRTNPLFLGAMTNMQAVLFDTESRSS